MSWNFDEGTGKKNFTKFPVGITRLRVLDDAPHMRWTHWMGQFQRSVNCPGRGCPICTIRKRQKANGEQYTYNMSRKFAINTYNHETGQPEITEQGVTFFEDLRDVMTDVKAEGHELRDVILKVRRRGTGKDDTSYRIDKEDVTPFSDAEQAADAEKDDLAEYFKPHTVAQINDILQVRAGTREEFQEAWNNIMNPESANQQHDDDDMPPPPPAPVQEDGSIDLSEEDIEIR